MASVVIWATLAMLIASGCSVLETVFDPSSAANTTVPNCAPTPSDMEGPYYLPDAPFTNQIAPEGLAGQRLIISGTVYASDCATPLAGAVVDVWQADANGEYDFSNQYILRGRVMTDENGRYEFETVMPGIYEPRPPHIHFKVSHGDAAPLTTQLYFEGHNNRGVQPTLIIRAMPDGDVMRGTFDIVLADG